jgi:LacI family transcriptional regulator
VTTTFADLGVPTRLVAALTAAGIDEPRTYLRTGAQNPDIAFRLTTELIGLPAPPTAVFASDSRVALGVLKAIRAAGLDVPRDISMVGFDDADWTSVVNPAISVVAQPTYELGRRAAELLLDEARSGGEHQHQQRLFQPELVVRESSMVRLHGADPRRTA